MKTPDAAAIAMSAIGTVTDVATYTLTVLGILIALLALFGFGAIANRANLVAKRIANKRFDDYMQSDEFRSLIKDRIEQTVQDRWRDTVVVRLAEATRSPDDKSPFPPGDTP